MKFTLQFEKGALRDLKKLEKPTAIRIVQKIQDVAKRALALSRSPTFGMAGKSEWARIEPCVMSTSINKPSGVTLLAIVAISTVSFHPPIYF